MYNDNIENLIISVFILLQDIHILSEHITKYFFLKEIHHSI